MVTSIVIDAPPDRVWHVLTAFDQYGRWHPTLEIRRGEPVPGSPIQMRIAAGTAAERAAEGTVLEATANHVLSWEGGMPGLLYGHHRFELAEQDGRTHLTNRESFTGSMVAEVMAGGREVLLAEFDAANQALKAYAEA
ncbi:hypothetical protein AOZ06_37070 [Kibdelosporangium phytohabitans]|uniref:Polyketide cyclase n=1 Tax=Kibdelosporangium phytohabitans TaxID=860235 RepID=A0A0N9IAF7_9PSEU|nr:hypothetical protein AOZ06_37070 [Kibdelosporangium phytohabitans]